MAEITIKDIAKQCGVGVSTVSRALNNHPDINPTTRKMILDVIEETGFIPNNSARNLKRTDAKCIAVLVKGITNPLYRPDHREVGTDRLPADGRLPAGLCGTGTSDRLLKFAL